MNRWNKGLAPALAVAALLSGVPAQAACWTEEDAALARVHDLRTKLTVASMRCETAGAGAAAQFQSFNQANRNALAVVSQRIKSRFWTAYGPDEGQRLLDRFAAALVDAHKGDGADCAATSALLQEAAANGGSVAALADLAERHGLRPSLPGGACGVKLAKR